MYRIDSNGVYIYSATVMPSLCCFYSKDNNSRIIDLLLIACHLCFAQFVTCPVCN